MGSPRQRSLIKERLELPVDALVLTDLLNLLENSQPRLFR